MDNVKDSVAFLAINKGLNMALEYQLLLLHSNALLQKFGLFSQISVSIR